jgi:UDP-glucose 4-epimerase
MYIIDLAKIFSTRFDSTIQITGMRPGEKLHEDLISHPESIRTRELSNHFVLEPPLMAEIQNNELFEYKSNQTLLDESNLENYLDSLGVFEMRLDDFLGHEIDEIRRS